MAYGARKLEAEFESNTKAKYIIEGEDHTLGNLLEKTLTTLDGVVVAYYEAPHPLEDKIILYIETDGSVKPREALRKALEKILEMNKTFRTLYLEKLKARRVDYSDWE
ncbi:DNA-directed RNA polymerase subunit L [Stetteria hydrogenophila]